MRLAELFALTPRELARRARKVIGFRLAERANERARRRFLAARPEEYRREVAPHALPGVRLFSFAGEGQFHLQVLSILSFLRHAGVPEQWTVVSDGSLSAARMEQLRGLHPSVEVRPWEEFLTPENRAAVEPYARLYPLGKKLALLSALPAGATCVYADSDVLFFAGAFRLRELLAAARGNYFVPDCGNAVIEDPATPAERALLPVNSGFLIQTRPPDWSEPLARLRYTLETAPAHAEREKHFLEQTVAHIAYHATGAEPLGPAYVIELSDAFEGEDRFCGPEIALRHYILHARSKFWGHAREYLRD